MWKQLWKKWTLDKPAAFGDLLWEVFVVQLAAFLDRLTLRQVIAFIPVVILVLAYSHSIPIPPELMLVGDVLAYLDIYSAILLLGLMSRVTTILFALKQTAALVSRLAAICLRACNGWISVTAAKVARGVKRRLPAEPATTTNPRSFTASPGLDHMLCGRR